MLRKKFLVFFAVLVCIHYLFGEIQLDTVIDMNCHDEYVLKAIFTFKKGKFTDENFFIKELPKAADYNITRQSYSEKIVKTDETETVKRTFSFFIQPLRRGKINIKSIEFVNLAKNKKFMTVPKVIVVKDYAQFKRHGKVLFLVILFFFLCFLIYIWMSSRQKKKAESLGENENQKIEEENSFEEIVQRIEQFLSDGKHREVITELKIAAATCSNEEYRAKLKLIISDNASAVKYGGEKFSENTRRKILGILQQMIRAENDDSEVVDKSRCPACGNIVSDRDEQCGKCGAEFEIIE